MFNKYIEFLIWTCCLIFLYNFHIFLDTNSIVYWYMEYGIDFNNLLSLLGSFFAGIIAILLWHNEKLNTLYDKKIEDFKSKILMFHDNIHMNTKMTQLSFDELYEISKYCLKIINDNDEKFKNDIKRHHLLRIGNNAHIFDYIFNLKLLDYVEIFTDGDDIDCFKHDYDNYIDLINDNIDHKGNVIHENLNDILTISGIANSYLKFKLIFEFTELFKTDANFKLTIDQMSKNNKFRQNDNKNYTYYGDNLYTYFDLIK